METFILMMHFHVLIENKLQLHSITKFVKKSYAGPLLKKEITAINLVIKNKKEPVTCIIGGSKISTKINVITNLFEKSK